MRVIFLEDHVVIGEANLTPARVAKAGVIQIEDSFFTFSRFDGSDVIFQRVDLLPLDDEEVNFDV